MGKIPELRRRIFYTIALLAIHRIGVVVTTPGVNASVMAKIVNPVFGQLLGPIQYVSGGALEKMSIFALGIMPYVSSSIILQLLTVVIPKLEQIQKEARWAAENQPVHPLRLHHSVVHPSPSSLRAGWFRTTPPTAIWARWFPIPTGTSTSSPCCRSPRHGFIMWLGEQITERGIGNGISLIIFAGIVTDIPDALARLWLARQGRQHHRVLLALMALIVVVVVAIIIFLSAANAAFRSIRQTGGRTEDVWRTIHPLAAQGQHLGRDPAHLRFVDLDVPTAGRFVLGQSLCKAFSDALHPGDWRYNVLYVGLIVFFCLLLHGGHFQSRGPWPTNMRKYGGFVPGIRPGKLRLPTSTKS